ncbi:MAG: 23S rRNA (pseudouridine(1915)-N(3))-methyltransferase RlmH [Acidobacteriota bacterium]|nr:23S rRNA (pseudouridine(1915)-N(3))-methyltransferase RlmH [Acidobacteriota bacterium]
MGRELIVLWSGRHRRDRWQDLVDEYASRLRSMRLRDQQVRSRREGSDEVRRRSEGKSLLGALPPKAWVVALDSGGRMLPSLAFSDRLMELEANWPHPVAFVIGSDVGLDEAVLDRSNEVLSLGPMTLPHELARLVLYEQIYRATTIRTGSNYHRSKR